MSESERTTGARRVRKWARVVIFLLVGVVLLVAVCWKPQPWDPLKAWGTLDQEDRYRVAERLVAGEVLVGMNQQELEQHLGEPGYVHDGGATLGWYVGDPPGTWFTLDTHFLEVKIAEGKAVAARLRVSRW